MKIGMMMPPHYPLAAVTEATLGVAQAISADSLWSFDHFLGYVHPELWGEMSFSEMIPDSDGFLDPFEHCAWVAPRVEQPLGIAVTDGIRRAAPDLARAALTLQHMCAGGFNLGIGGGELENLAPFGYPTKGLVTTTESVLSTLRHIFDTGVMPSGPGRFAYPTAAAAGKPRIWVAAHKPRMLDLAGKYGDGWLPISARTPGEYRAMKETIARHATAADRAEPESGLIAVVILSESCAKLRELFDAEPLAKLLALPSAYSEDWQRHGSRHPLDPDGRAFINYIPHNYTADTLRAVAPGIPFEVLEERIFLGSVTEVADRLIGYVTAGCEHLILYNFTGLVGGIAEAMKRGPDFVRLVEMIRGAAAELAT